MNGVNLESGRSICGTGCSLPVDHFAGQDAHFRSADLRDRMRTFGRPICGQSVNPEVRIFAGRLFGKKFEWQREFSFLEDR